MSRHRTGWLLRALVLGSLIPVMLMLVSMRSNASELPPELPAGFVHLSDIAPDIPQSIRYATPDNFTRSALPGYAGASCVLARPVAEALATAQRKARSQNLTLLVYDCYRPARAVQAMMRAVQSPGGTDPSYHPNMSSRALVSRGYVAARSGHSSGGSIDLTLAEIQGQTAVPLPMGTVFDFFDPASHTKAPGIEASILRNREQLVSLMAEAGFTNYRKEWWHFRYRNEPYRGQVFDFPIPKPD